MDAYISKSKRWYNPKPSAYNFHMKTNILANFCICISFPLMNAVVKKFAPAFCYSFLKIDENDVNLKYIRFSCLT